MSRVKSAIIRTWLTGVAVTSLRREIPSITQAKKKTPSWARAGDLEGFIIPAPEPLGCARSYMVGNSTRLDYRRPPAPLLVPESSTAAEIDRGPES